MSFQFQSTKQRIGILNRCTTESFTKTPKRFLIHLHLYYQAILSNSLQESKVIVIALIQTIALPEEVMEMFSSSKDTQLETFSSK
jgi:hypothetical protein